MISRRSPKRTKQYVIIDNELEVFKGHLQTVHVDKFLPPLNQYVEDIRQRELDRAVKMVDPDDEKTKLILEGLSKTLSKKIMHNFMSEIRTSQTSSSEMERFVKIFLGDDYVSHIKDETIEE